MTNEEALHALELEVSRKIGAHVRDTDYPEAARAAGLSGTSWIDVLVGRDGQIKKLSIHESSGYPLLDAQALEMVGRARLWWIPQGLRNREVSVVVPIAFRQRSEP